MDIGKNLKTGNSFDELINKKLGEKIKIIRKKLKITQKQLGEMIDKKEITIRKYESGAIIPNLEVLNKIAEALKVDINSLLIEKGKTHIFNENTGKHYIFDTPFIENSSLEEKDDLEKDGLKLISVSANIKTALDEYFAVVSPNERSSSISEEKQNELYNKILNLIELETFTEKKKKNKEGE